MLNTDDVQYEGAGRVNGDLHTEPTGSHGMEASAVLQIPAHTARWFVLES